MDGEAAVPARNRTALAAIVVAAVALGAFAVVGAGVLLGWIPRGAVPDAPPAAPARAPSHGLEKFSGSEPLMPKYSQPHAPPPAPVQEFPAEARPVAPPVMPAPMPAPGAPPAAPGGRFASGDAFGPAPPIFGRSEPRAAPAPAPQRRARCDDCGRVIGIANWRSGWEMRVRFEDGSTQTFNFRRRPPFELGERVRLEGDELISD